MTVCVLGPLETDGQDLSPRERVVLSALVIRRARTVARDELADACWGAEPPSTWKQQIQNAVARIRSRLGRDAVRTIGAGYRLGVPDDAVDVVRFEREIARARAHSAEGAPDRAVAAYRRALALWRGDPFPDVLEWPPAHAEAVRLKEIRADVEEELLDARLRLGEGAVIPDAERLVRIAPLREHRWATLALANYRAGRQAEAAAVVRSARARLVEELGIDLGRELRELELDILRQDPALDPPGAPLDQIDSVESECPYPGLAPYGVDDAERFFGRDEDVGALVARVRSGAIVTLVGPSGSGKSSVLRAGVVPRLRDSGRRVVVVDPDAAGLDTVRAIVHDEPSVLAIDQAEELLALPVGERDEILELVAAWVGRGGSVILSLRSDFLDRATSVTGIGTALGRDVFALPPMDHERLRAAITGPADAAGLHRESGLIELVLRDAGDVTATLPAMSHALAATWERRDGRTLTIAGYESAGGIAGAIAQSAEQVYLSLVGDGPEVCRSLMMRLLERTAEGATVRRRVAIDVLTAGATHRRVLEALVEARLVTADRDSVIVAHEAVGRAWPRLDAWLTADAADARLLRQIETAAAAWETAGRTSEDLLRGARLQDALEWQERTSPALTDVESAYLEASAVAHHDEVRALTERAARERVRNRRLRTALVAAAALLVAAVVASSVAVVRSVEARASAEDARVEALTTTALSTRTNLETAALLAAEIHRRWPDDPRAFIALQGVLDRADGLVRTVRFAEGARVAVTIVPGTRVAIATVDPPIGGTADASAASLHLIDLTTGQTVDEIPAPLPPLGATASAARDISVSADGSTALVVTTSGSAEADGCCVRLDVVPLRADGSGPQAMDLRVPLVGDPALSEDGTVAFILMEGSAAPIRVDLRTGELVSTADPSSVQDDPEVEGITLVDGAVYVGARDHIRVYDPVTLALTREIRLPVARNVSVTSRHLGPDDAGGLLAFAPYWSARVNASSGAVIWARTGLGCAAPVVLPDSTFMCTRDDGMWVHSLDTGEPLRRVLPSLPSDATAVAWMTGVSELATLSADMVLLQRWRPSGDYSVETAADMRDAACAIAGRQFTEGEWDRFFADDAYADTCSGVPPPIG